MLDEDPADDTMSTPAETGTTPATDRAPTRTTGTATRRRRAAGRPAGPPVATFSAAAPVAPAPVVPTQPPAAAPTSRSTRKTKLASTSPPAAQNSTGDDTALAAVLGAGADRPVTDHGADSADRADSADGADRAGGTADATAPGAESPAAVDTGDDTDTVDSADGEGSTDGGSSRRRRRRGGRRRRKSGSDEGTTADQETSGADAAADTGQAADDDTDGVDDAASPSADGDESAAGDGTSSSSRRRRRRRRRGEEPVPAEDDPANTVVRVRERKAAEDEITSVQGSTRLEAKKQRRREGRDAGRRRAPIVSEAEFLARRESVEREMVVRRRGDLTQIAVLEDNVLAEHYVARGSQTSMIGNVFLGRVQNLLPSMEAAFIDIGKGRNAVLYAGEVDWKALSGEGRPRRIEEALTSGQSVLVQVTKDPVGNKGARLTSQVSLPGRFLVYVPGGHTSGISRKLPDTERNRLKALLKDIVPSEAGVIVRTAAEGATEDQLTRDVAALTARWEDISRKASGQGPKLLYAEPDLMIKVVRDLYNEDFKGLTVQGDEAWEDVQSYVDHVAPDLGERLQRWDEDQDVFAAYRINEQIAKGTERKVWLPSGGSLVIDRTEAMTVVDVNTGKFTGSGGNLEETVTKNNLEAAEEFVRQLRLRDIGGIIVIDFIDMVLEDNRDLVLRRLVECLGRDRTRHQVAEVTSLGLVQMTRKRIGTGLLEAFSEPCTCCQGRGFHVLAEPVAESAPRDEDGPARGHGGEGRGRGRTQDATDAARSAPAPTETAEPRPRARPRPPEPKGIAAEPTPAEPPVEPPAEPTAEPTSAEPDPTAVNSSPTPEPEVLANPTESSVPVPGDEQVPAPEPKPKRARRAPRSTPKLSADAVAVATADADNSDDVSRTTAQPASAKSPEDSPAEPPTGH